jgi:hypothetical protein
MKFLLKDISEIEELFAEKGTDGFDELEMEFIRTRFNGAKHIIQLLSKKDVPAQRVMVSAPDKSAVATEPEPAETKNSVNPQATFSDEEKESLAALSDFEEELKHEESKPEPVVQDEEVAATEQENKIEEETASEGESEVIAEEEESAPEVEEEITEEEPKAQ